MYQDIRQWTIIRRRVLVDRCSKRQVVRESGISWQTLEKMLRHPFPPAHKRKRKCLVAEPKLPTRNSSAHEEQICRDVLNLLAAAQIAGVRTILSAVSSINPQRATSNDLAALRDKLKANGFGSKPSSPYFMAEPHEWMLRVMQGAYSVSEIRAVVGDVPGLDQTVNMARNGTLNDRKRAMLVLARLRKISLRVAAGFLHNSENTVLKHWKAYAHKGVGVLFHRYNYNTTRVPKSQDEDVKKAVFAVLHAPPHSFNINRTTWRMEDLQKCLARNGTTVSRDVIRAVIKSAGYKWRKAKVVLTSSDPLYREKLDHIQGILSHLRADERFFSIDEFGPFAVKAKGGRRLVAPDFYPSVQQHQKSKGCLIITAALELSRNQVTHFYSAKKNTEEMVKLLYLLLDQSKECTKVYLSWDAASWHASKLLYRSVEKVNSTTFRKKCGTPSVELAPLPASAQFLNIIESVFSGMAKAIIHNSNYTSVEAAMAAIDRYFKERNEYFRSHPKRAGKKIWGKELTPAVFDETQNCKDPRWSCPRR